MDGAHHRMKKQKKEEKIYDICASCGILINGDLVFYNGKEYCGACFDLHRDKIIIKNSNMGVMRGSQRIEEKETKTNG